MPKRTPSLPRVVVTVAAAQLTELGEHARRESAHFRCVELRLDYLSPAALDDTRGIARLIRTLRQRKVAAIATLRSAAAGGHFAGSAEQQLRVLEVAARAGASLVDLEIESAEHLGAASVRGLRKLAPLMVSFHDYRETPSSLPMVLGQLQRFPADYHKLVTMAHDPLDNAAVLDLLKLGKGRLVAFTLGEIGRPTRVLCLKEGSPFTFAAAVTGGVPGIGQIPAALMQGMYRATQITKRTRVYGVVGHPIAHSLSPVIHNAGFAKLGLDAVYLPFDAADFDLFWSGFARRLQGLSITMPHKEAAAHVASHRDAVADRAGAANTLVRKGNAWIAHNTDTLGIVGPLAKRIHLPGARVLVAGAGGAARAAIFPLIEAGCKVSVTNRTAEHAQALAAESGAAFVERSSLTRAKFDVIVHATPLGMTPDVKSCFFQPEELNAQILFETVYTPATTKLMRMAKRRGMEVISGVEMFVTQAVEQFRIWTGKPAPQKVMEDALRAALPK